MLSIGAVNLLVTFVWRLPTMAHITQGITDAFFGKATGFWVGNDVYRVDKFRIAMFIEMPSVGFFLAYIGLTHIIPAT